MTDQIITLRTGFEIAHGDYEQVMEAVRKANLSYACVAKAELAKKIETPEYDIRGIRRPC